MRRLLGSVRFLWLLARRDWERFPRNSALVVVLLAVPVLALTAGATLLATTALSREEQVRFSLGASDYLLSHRADLAEPAPLPGEVRRVTETDLRGAAVDAGGVRHRVDVRDLAADDPLVRDLVHVLSGRVPRSEGEVAISPTLLNDQRLALGGVVTLDQPAGQYRVVGVVQNPLNVQGRQLLLPPGSAHQLDPALVLERRHYVEGVSSDVAGLQDRGVRVVSRSDAGGARVSGAPRPEEAAAIVLAMLTVVIVSAGALGITARRHGREAAILSVNGARPAHIAARLMLYSAPLAALGAGGGAGVGVGLGALLTPAAERFTGQLVGDLTVPAASILGIVTLAIGSALVAAWLTALWVVNRKPRRTLSSPASGWGGALKAAIAGLILVGAGIAGTAQTGPVAAAALPGLVVGAALLGPLALRLLSVLAGPLPLAVRLGLRDAARCADRTTPAVSALVATVTCAVAGASYLLTADAAARASYVPQLAPNQVVVRNMSSEGPVPPAAGEKVAAELPTQALRPLLAAEARGSGGTTTLAYVGPQVGGSPMSNLYLGDLETLSALGGDAQRSAFLAGAVVVLDEALARDGRTGIWWSELSTTSFSAVQRAATSSPTPAYVTGPRALISQPAASQLGLAARQQGVILSLARAPSPEEVTRAQQALDLFPGLELVREVGYQSNVNRQVLVVVATAMLLALLTALGVASLTAQELGPFLDTLRAIGASPGTGRLVAGLQAGASSLAGTTLGAGAGLLAASLISPAPVALAVPWPALALLVVLTPVLTASFAVISISGPAMSHRHTL